MPSWTPALATGDEQIDNQHREIFRRVDVLHAAMLRGDERESARLLDFLGSYVADHFGAEERAMRESAYPEQAGHKAEHVRFIRDYLAISGDFQRQGPGAELAERLKRWLEAWLTQHILRSDVALAGYLIRGAFGLDEL